jgi:hypothetical protein
MIMKIAVGFPALLHIGIQPVIVHNLKSGRVLFPATCGVKMKNSFDRYPVRLRRGSSSFPNPALEKGILIISVNGRRF